MRRVVEREVWSALRKSNHSENSHIATFGSIALDLGAPCVVLGGRNGAGKTRVLRSVAEHLGDGGLFLDLHSLCEQALAILRSRDDFEEMLEEFDVLGPDMDRSEDVCRVIGRDYELVEWYALEVESSDENVSRKFSWNGEQPLLPYFKATHNGVCYSSGEMGLGEFSVHLLFWVLEQYRGSEGLTVILDEPDAYLPPIGASSLLFRLLNLCLTRGWRLIVSTHSSEIIAEALEEQAFVYLRAIEDGGIEATHCVDDPAAADGLLSRPPVRHVFYVEDESAWMLTRVLLESFDRRLSRSVAVVWGNGSGYMVDLRKKLPKPRRPEVKFAYVFDGDKRKEVGPSKSGQWPTLFLPTDGDPDDLYRSTAALASDLAGELNVPVAELQRFFDQREGEDSHDWVNDLAAEYGRQLVLRKLAEVWVRRNNAAAQEFLTALKSIV